MTPLVAAAQLSDRYITDRSLPDKAIDLIDEAASRVRLQLAMPPAELRQREAGAGEGPGGAGLGSRRVELRPARRSFRAQEHDLTEKVTELERKWQEDRDDEPTSRRRGRDRPHRLLAGPEFRSPGWSRASPRSC